MSTFQSLTLPIEQQIELGQLLKQLGYRNPTHYNYSYLRQALTAKNFIKLRVHGRKEYWVHESQRSNFLSQDTARYTPESFRAKFLPGITNPDWPQIEKIMRSRGLRPRMDGLYWSMIEPRRSYLRNPLPKPSVPRYVCIPKGAFNLWDMLHVNNMRRTPENLAWAREELKLRGITKPPHMTRYVAPDHRGKLPAPVTGAWEAPASFAFTTYQFQKFNNATHPTKDEWRSALEWLDANGFKFDPRWKRWKKS